MKAVEVIKGNVYWVNDDEGQLISAKWDGENWQKVTPPKAKNPEEIKSITTISGSKYSYTEQQGESLISIGFDKYDELVRHLTFERQKIYKHAWVGKQEKTTKQ